MDEMKISSKFTRMLLSKLAKGVLHKKLGYDIDIQLNELSIFDECLYGIPMFQVENHYFSRYE